MHATTSKVENSAQGSSCKLKFVHASDNFDGNGDLIVKGILAFYSCFYVAKSLVEQCLAKQGLQICGIQSSAL